jgi:hypothetical protein
VTILKSNRRERNKEQVLEITSVLPVALLLITRRWRDPMSKKQSQTGHRDSKTGRFVTEKHAKDHPRTTQKESIPNPGKGDTGRVKKK